MSQINILIQINIVKHIIRNHIIIKAQKQLWRPNVTKDPQHNSTLDSLLQKESEKIRKKTASKQSSEVLSRIFAKEITTERRKNNGAHGYWKTGLLGKPYVLLGCRTARGEIRWQPQESGDMTLTVERIEVDGDRDWAWEMILSTAGDTDSDGSSVCEGLGGPREEGSCTAAAVMKMEAQCREQPAQCSYIWKM